MINKKIIENAKQQFKEDTAKLVNELTKKREISAAPKRPLNAKSLIAKRSEFKQNVANRVASFSKSKEYLDYLGTAKEDTITA